MRAPRWIVAVLVGSAACHDWDRFGREYVEPDGGTGADGFVSDRPLEDGGSNELQGVEEGAFGCAAPYVLVPITDARGARIERIRPSGQACAALRVWGFRAGEPIRAVALDEPRVLAAGDRGACALDVFETRVQGRFMSYPGAVDGGEVRDALTLFDLAPRFAVALAVRTSSAINHLVVEDELGELSQVRTASSSPAIPAALLRGGFLRSLTSERTAPFRLIGGREAPDYLVSVSPDGSDPQTLLQSSSAPDLYETVSAGPPDSLSRPWVAMVPRAATNQFNAFAGGVRTSGLVCSPCRSVTHVVPIDVNQRQYAVLCRISDGSSALFARTTTCDRPLRTWPAQTIVGRMALQWP